MIQQWSDRTDKLILTCLTRFPWTRGWLKRTPHVSTFVKYCAVGGIGVFLDLCVLFLLTEIAGIYYIYSALIGFFVLDALSYIVHKTFTFKNKDKKYLKQYFWFLMVSISGIIIDVSFLYVLTEFVGIYYLVSKIFSITISTVANYVLSLLVFK